LLQIHNGAGRFEVGNTHMVHALDGFAKVISVQFNVNGDAWFSSNFLQTDFYKASTEQGKIAAYQVLDSVRPDFTWTDHIKAMLRGPDNTNVNIIKLGNATVGEDFAAMTDVWKVYTVDPKSLETLGRVKAEIPGGHSLDSLTSQLSSSHPMPEYGTTNHITFVTDINPIPGLYSHIKVVRMRSVHLRELIASIPVEQAPYMHSFACTRNYAILFVNPVFVDVGVLFKTGSPMSSLQWQEQHHTTVYVIDIHTGQTTEMTTEGVFTLHQVNAYESPDGEFIHVDYVTYPNMEAFTSLKLESLRDKSKRDTVLADATLKRYTIDMTSKSIQVGTLSVNPRMAIANKLDFPVINEAYRYSPYCFVYGVASKSDSVHMASTLVKRDLCGKGRDRVYYAPNQYPS